MAHQINKLPIWAQQHISALEADRDALLVEVQSLRREDRAVWPDVPPPVNRQELSTGWLFNIHGLFPASARSENLAYKACSSVTGYGTSGWDKTSAQGARHLFSTQKLALLAARSAFIKWSDEALVKIEKMIQEADQP
jgi:hypothetical protein